MNMKFGDGSPTAPPLPGTAEELLPLVYEELRRMAAQRMARESPGQTLQATALVHDAWIKLGDGRFENRAHFFAAAAEAMRRILVDNARRKQAVKHGGERPVLAVLFKAPYRDAVHATGSCVSSHLFPCQLKGSFCADIVDQAEPLVYPPCGTICGMTSH